MNTIIDLMFKNFRFTVIYFTREDLFREDWKEHCLYVIKSTEKYVAVIK